MVKRFGRLVRNNRRIVLAGTFLVLAGGGWLYDFGRAIGRFIGWRIG